MESGNLGEGKEAMKDLLTRESLVAIFAMQTSADLENRMRVVRERKGVPDSQLIPFFAVMPDDYSLDEQRKWIHEITESLSAVVADAELSIKVDRTLATMVDLGIGDDGNGGTRED